MSGTNPNDGVGLSQFQMQALMQHLERLMKQRDDALHERLDQMENRDHNEEERRRRGNDGVPRQNRIDGIKLNIPPFKGKNDPEAYLEWEMKIEHVFSCNNYEEDQKVKLAATEFSDYALVWWNKLQKERARNEEPMVDTWTEMKKIMRKRYVPASYSRDLKFKLQKLTQGNKGVEEYFKEMDVLMIQANIEEDEEVTMARFLNGLTNDIRDIVELQEFVEMDDLLHKAIQVEQQLKRKGVAKRSFTNFGSSSWKDKGKKDGAATSSSSTPIPSKTRSKSQEEPSKRSRDVKCFKCQGLGHYAYECPNKRSMVLRDGEYISESDVEEEEESEYVEEEETPEGDLLMIRRLLGGQLKHEEESQRENIFHTRCLINGKVCMVIIDGGSCTNVASARLVSKLNLATKPHPRPYKLQWLSKDGEVQVRQQVEVDVSIGKYNDKVLCDVVPMEATHLLLGRPWKFDKRANHDGFTNKISFTYQGKKIVLKPLSPQEVCEDQKKMREKLLQEKREKEKVSKTLESEKKRETLERKKSEQKKSETLEVRESYLPSKSEVERLFRAKQSLYILFCKNQILTTNTFDDFEVVYGFNPLTPLDLLPMHNVSVFKHKEGQAKADYVKKLHERVKDQIERKNKSYAKQANKGRKKVVFEPGDWVWVHMRKERFPEQRKSKLQPRGDGPFQVLERINDNAYKVELPGEYNVSSTFNVSDLSLFDADGESDLRTNPSQEGENDEDMTKSKGKDPLEGLGGPMTRARARKAKEALQQVLSILFEYKPKFQGEKSKVVSCIMAQMEED